MAKMNHSRLRHRGKPTEEAFPKDEPPAGPWTHRKRYPGRILTPSEVAAALVARRKPKPDPEP